MSWRLTVAALAACLAASPACGEGLRKKVLIIGMDGCRPDTLAIANTPTLDALKAGGAWSPEAQTDPHTKSGPCWSSMLCGVWDDKHGAVDNELNGTHYDLYPDFFTRLESINPSFNTVSICRFADINNKVVQQVDVKTNCSSDDQALAVATNLLATADPDVLWVVFLDVDSAGHIYGFTPAAAGYVAAMEEMDTRMGVLVQAVTQRPACSEEDWLILNLSDHGGLPDGTHGGDTPEQRTIFYGASGPSAARGKIYPAPTIVDIAATVFAHLGVPVDPAWNLDARPAGLPLPPPRYGSNLIFNGEAEWNSGTNGYTPNRITAWWSDVGPMTLGVYGSTSNFPSAASPGPPEHGNNFFLGGAGGDSSMTQKVDVAALGADIDEPSVDYRLSGWFGGAGWEPDDAFLTVRFLDGAGSVLETNSVGPVSAQERGGVTGLMARSANGAVPAGTRLLEFVLAARADDATNNGTADNLSFVLTRQPDMRFPVAASVGEGGEWQVEFDSLPRRSYTLEQSSNLWHWTELLPPALGTGGPLAMTDTNAPETHAYYRVRCRRE